ncbi:carbohydrate-binding module family 1 protein [Cadophora sp. DSE1049]|nr:carbohydrate-binding module family 1 protein [Cadophora sp. DSE1049]
MKYSQIIAGAAVASVAQAHTTIWNMFVNDVNQGVGNIDGGYIRYPPSNSPVKDITSKDMTCNVANVAADKTIAVAAGDKLTLEWHHDDNTAGDNIIDSSHVGPVMVYIAPTASNGAGDVWVKLAEDGYDGSKWAVQKLIANKGKHDVTLPSTLADGDYLVRGEIIALHEADKAFTADPVRGAQFYMECIQITVSGGGATVLPAGVSIPGAYSYSDPGVVFNVYGPYSSYTIPGPAVWDGASSGTAPVASSAAPVASSTAAAIPATTAAPVSSSQAPVATDVASDLEPVTELPSSTAPAATAIPVQTSAPIATSSKSACKAKTSTAAPIATSTKSACKAKTSTVAPVSTKSACTAKSIVAVPTTLATVAKPIASGVSGAAVAKYGQCGGTGYTGSSTCAEGSTCTVQNPYYSQCI